MALLVNVLANESDVGLAITGAYAKASLALKFENHRGKKYNQLTVNIYASQEARDAGSRPVLVINEQVEAAIDTIQKAYSYLKASRFPVATDI